MFEILSHPKGEGEERGDQKWYLELPLTLGCPKISNIGNLHQPQHFHILLENEMLKNVRILKIGPRLGGAIERQSFST